MGHSTHATSVGRNRLVQHGAGVVLAITLPTIPIHAFFGTLMTVWSVLALIVAAVGLRGATPTVAVQKALR